MNTQQLHVYGYSKPLTWDEFNDTELGFDSIRMITQETAPERVDGLKSTTLMYAKMDTEMWCDVPGYPGYKVSNMGQVMSYKGKEPRALKPRDNNYGYLVVTLCREGSKKGVFKIQRLVVGTFLGLTPGGYNICHCDGDKTNNALSNLRIGTAGSNARDKYVHGVTEHAKGKTQLDVDKQMLADKYHGISWLVSHQSYKAQACIPGLKGQQHIGNFKSPFDAAEAYDRIRRRYPTNSGNMGNNLNNVDTALVDVLEVGQKVAKAIARIDSKLAAAKEQEAA